MFWQKKTGPPPIPGGATSQVPPLRDDLSPEFKEGLKKELELAGAGDDTKDVLTASIGLIRAGMHELLPGWLKQFGKADVFVVSVEENNPQTAFVFGPKEDRNYVAVFTRLDLAMECLRQFPTLKFAMKLNGLDLLKLACNGRRGIWINPVNEACSVRFPADIMKRFIEDVESNQP